LSKNAEIYDYKCIALEYRYVCTCYDKLSGYDHSVQEKKNEDNNKKVLSKNAEIHDYKLIAQDFAGLEYRYVCTRYKR